jgi:hypothetical protein
MAVDYKIYLHINTDQPGRHKYNQKNIFITRENITYKAEHRPVHALSVRPAVLPYRPAGHGMPPDILVFRGQ